MEDDGAALWRKGHPEHLVVVDLERYDAASPRQRDASPSPAVSPPGSSRQRRPDPIQPPDSSVARHPCPSPQSGSGPAASPTGVSPRSRHRPPGFPTSPSASPRDAAAGTGPAPEESKLRSTVLSRLMAGRRTASDSRAGDLERAVRDTLLSKNSQIAALRDEAARLRVLLEERERRAAVTLLVRDRPAAPHAAVDMDEVRRAVGEGELDGAPEGQRAGMQEVRRRVREALLRVVREGQLRRVVEESAPLTPADAVSVLRSEAQQLTSRSVKRVKTALARADRAWMAEFVGAEGLAAIIAAARAFEAQQAFEMGSIVCQAQLILCLRAVVNNRVGIEALIGSGGAQRGVGELVALAWCTRNVMMRTQVLDLMSAMCLYSTAGYRVVDLALAELSVSRARRGDRLRFLKLVEWMQEQSDPQTKACRTSVVAFVNALVCTPEGLEERLEVRGNFVDLGAAAILDIVRKEVAADEASGPVADLLRQIDTFFEEMEADDRELEAIKNELRVDLTDAQSMLAAIRLRVRDRRAIECSLLNVLRSLLLLPPSDSAAAEPLWGVVEDAAARTAALAIGGASASPEDSQRLRLAWSKLPAMKVKKTMWVSQGLNTELPPVNTDEIATLFCANPPKKPDDAGKPAEKAAPKVVSLLDMKRSNNTAIVMSQFKGLSYEEIRAKIAAGDDAALGSVEALRQVLPQSDEMELLRGFAGDRAALGRAEQWFLCIGELPNAQKKVDALCFKRSFFTRAEDLQVQLAGYEMACKQVTENTNLCFVLKWILAIGNELNAGTEKGNAQGFRVDTLSKLQDLRSPVQGKKTLLSYVVEKLLDVRPEVADFPDSLSKLQAVVNSSPLNDLISQVSKLVEEVEVIDKDVSSSHSDSPQFVESMSDFIARALVETQLILEQCEAVEKALYTMLEAFGEEVEEGKIPEPSAVRDFFAHLLKFSSQFKAVLKDIQAARERELKKKKREQSGAGGDKRKGAAPTSPNNGECVVDALLSSIKEGNFKLRRGNATAPAAAPTETSSVP
eukprot:m51a1_g5939 putative inverted formin-2 (1022) ;mRNA; f:111272-116339